MKSFSIKTYLLMLIVAMTAIPLAIIVHDTNKQIRRNLDESYLMLERLAQDIENNQKAFHTSTEQLLSGFEALPSVQRHEAAATTDYLRHLAGKSPHLTNIYLADTCGAVWASAAPLNGVVSVADRRHFRNAMATGTFASGQYVVGKMLKKPIINFAYPVRNRSGTITDIAAVSFVLENYENLLTSRKYSKYTSLVLTDHQGTILYSSVGPTYTGRPDKLFSRMQGLADEGRFEAVGNSGVNRIHYYKKVRLAAEQAPYLYIRAGMANKPLFDEANRRLLKNFGIMFLLLLSASTLTLYLSKKLVLDKIGALQAAMNQVAAGDLTVRVAEYASGGELSELGRSFDRMTERLNQDIIERKHAEEEVSKSEERLRIIFEASPAGIIMVDPVGIITFANQRMAEMFDCPLHELVGSGYSDHLHPDAKQAGDTRMRQLISGEIAIVETERHYVRSDGSDFWGYLSGRRLEQASGEFLGLIGIIADITDRKLAEVRLRDSEEKFAAIFNCSPDSININNLETSEFIDVNESFTRMLGYTRSEVVGKRSKDIGVWIDPKDRDQLAAQLRHSGSVRNLEAKLRRKDGTIITSLVSSTLIDVNGTPCTLNIARDITERDLILAELSNMQKLESLGVLAGGIAHDFNNILTGIMGNISFARARLDNPELAGELLGNAENASRRASELAKQLLMFAKGGKPVKKPLHVKELLREALALSLTGTNVKGVLDIPEPLRIVEADGGQLGQACHNIIINAVHAMPEGGTLTVAGRNRELPEQNLMNLPPGPYLELAFIDQGHGISAEHQARVFDPYFTTKEGGTGLGLASTYAIVKNHGGRIMLSSSVGTGTTFTMYLPAHDASEDVPPPVPVTETGGAPGQGSILVMDDEAMIRMMAAQMLEHFGYTAATCASGTEALELYRAARTAGTPFAAVILDLTIPGGMGGEVTARRILDVDPRAVLIVSSGYADNPVMADPGAYGFAAAIEKPYDVTRLGEVVARALQPSK